MAVGRRPDADREETTVAKALADYVQASHAKFDGMLLAGDNFYVIFFCKL